MRRFLLGLALGLASTACAPEFDVPSELDSLRILAVQKSEPYARPGDTVTLTMLDHDGSPSAPRQVNRLWLTGCENPPGDLYPGCFLQFAERFAEGADPAGLLDVLQFGPQARITVGDEIISDRPAPSDTDVPPYGLAYTFFAACAGDFGVPEDRDPLAFPIACYEPDDDLLNPFAARVGSDNKPEWDVAGRERLGQDDFVVGYSAIFVYDELTNRNPRFVRFEVEGEAVPEDCRGLDCVDLASPPPAASPDGGAPSDGGVLDGGVPTGGAPSGPPVLGDDCDLSDPRCILICTRKDQDACPTIRVQAVADSRSREEDAVLKASGRPNIGEQMWINYYVDRGAVSPAVKLLADATKGWNDEHDTSLRAPNEPGPVRIWGAAHDNRGGVQWIRTTLYARRRP